MTVACPLCNSDATARYARHAEAGQEMRKCRACGFYFVDPHQPWIPSVTDDEEPETFKFWGNDQAHTAYSRWRKEENDRIAQLILTHGPYDRLLEIGFGEGPLTKCLIGNVGEYWGIEPVTGHYRETIRELGLNKDRCLCIQAENMLTEPRLLDHQGTFNAIVMVSVFEHLSHPSDVLAACHRLLAPGGQLFLSTPDSTFFPYLTVLRRWSGIEPWSRFHISFFTRRSLTSAFHRAGFEVGDCQSHTLLTSSSIDYYHKLKNSALLGNSMRVFSGLGLGRLLRVSTLFYRLVKECV